MKAGVPVRHRHEIHPHLERVLSNVARERSTDDAYDAAPRSVRQVPQTASKRFVKGGPKRSGIVDLEKG